MARRWMVLLGCVVLSLLTTVSLAQYRNGVFSVEYSKISPIKNILLKKATLIIKIYYYGYPRGHFSVVTDEKQQFILGYDDKDQIALELIAISGQEKYKALCRGESKPGQLKLIVVCSPHKKTTS
ncbi:TPA: hypothetical protein NHI63_002549 [Legionella pneumophila]|uniref:Uncharacterized protein n=2 Tax=Legionella TaxID=445 RepID=A0AAP3HGN7_LEGPN|nr:MULTISPECIES: hypothetical protein [Legionella]MCZ4692053.1 hypothetical protein [Legionella pneumophila]MCZ4709366.1 hypothetical protein [Legionella pneumophila]MCZ4720978.1 hypothetical protein [Legionella pneumophila]HCE5384976.1 hypothetical protein [Legionella pneumophila]HCE5511857.1 hypothetical protein [Legionella pneumophila]